MKKNGFTLIELLVVIVIASFLTGGALATFNRFNEREKLKAAALTIKTVLREIQTQVLAAEKDPIACQAKTLDYWCADLLSKTTYGHCGGEDPLTSTNFGIKKIDLPTSVTLSFYSPEVGNPEDTNRAIIRFKPMTQGVENGSIICLSSSGSNQKYKLQVSTSGEIADFGFVQNCP